MEFQPWCGIGGSFCNQSSWWMVAEVQLKETVQGQGNAIFYCFPTLSQKVFRLICVHACTLSKNAHSALIAVAACLHNFYF